MQVVMPQMGETVDEGTIVKWLVQVGDEVGAGEPLLEIETDKVDVEIPAPASGRLTEILAAPGAVVTVGAPIGVIDEAGSPR
jgi:pyruvate/2-oxoglutarate dehydrogenase complex dihydrolipoamide acyltransferase (E2) component